MSDSKLVDMASDFKNRAIKALVGLVDDDSDCDAPKTESYAPKRPESPIRRQAAMAASKKKAPAASDESDDDVDDGLSKQAEHGDSDEDFGSKKSKKRTRTSSGSKRTKSSSKAVEPPAATSTTDSAASPAELSKEERKEAARQRDIMRKRNKRAEERALREAKKREEGENAAAAPDSKTSKAASSKKKSSENIATGKQRDKDGDTATPDAKVSQAAMASSSLEEKSSRKHATATGKQRDKDEDAATPDAKVSQAAASSKKKSSEKHAIATAVTTAMLVNLAGKPKRTNDPSNGKDSARSGRKAPSDRSSRAGTEGKDTKKKKRPRAESDEATDKTSEEVALHRPRDDRHGTSKRQKAMKGPPVDAVRHDQHRPESMEKRRKRDEAAAVEAHKEEPAAHDTRVAANGDSKRPKLGKRIYPPSKSTETAPRPSPPSSRQTPPREAPPVPSGKHEPDAAHSADTQDPSAPAPEVAPPGDAPTDTAKSEEVPGQDVAALEPQPAPVESPTASKDDAIAQPDSKSPEEEGEVAASEPVKYTKSAGQTPSASSPPRPSSTSATPSNPATAVAAAKATPAVPDPSPPLENLPIPKKGTKTDQDVDEAPIPRRNHLTPPPPRQRRPSPPPPSSQYPRQSSPPRSVHSRGKGAPLVNTYTPPPPPHPLRRDLRHFEYTPSDLKFYDRVIQYGSVARLLPPFWPSARPSSGALRPPTKYAVMLPPTATAASTVYVEPKPFGRSVSQRAFEDQRAEFYGIALQCSVPLRNEKDAHAHQVAVETDVANPVLNALTPYARTWVQRHLYSTTFHPLSARHRVTVLFRHMRYTHTSGGIMFNAAGVCHAYAKALADRFAVPAAASVGDKVLPCVDIPPDSWKDLQKSKASHVYAMYFSMEDAQVAVTMHKDDDGRYGCIVQDVYFVPPPPPSSVAPRKDGPRDDQRPPPPRLSESHRSISATSSTPSASPLQPPLPPQESTRSASRWSSAPLRASPPPLEPKKEEQATDDTRRKDSVVEDGEIPDGFELQDEDRSKPDEGTAAKTPPGSSEPLRRQKEEADKEDRRERSRDRSSRRPSRTTSPPFREGGAHPEPSPPHSSDKPRPREPSSGHRRSSDRANGAVSGRSHERDAGGRSHHFRRSLERSSFSGGGARRGSRSPDRRHHGSSAHGGRSRERPHGGRQSPVVCVSCPGMTSDEQLMRSFLHECGHVVNIEWRLTTPGKEFAYVTFQTPAAAAIAVRVKDRALLGNVPARVEPPRGRPSHR